MRFPLWVLLALAATACPQPQCPIGGLDCPCTVDNTCDTGLICTESNTCIGQGADGGP